MNRFQGNRVVIAVVGSDLPPICIFDVDELARQAVQLALNKKMILYGARVAIELQCGERSMKTIFEVKPGV
jgi:hypothetical protein